MPEESIKAEEEAKAKAGPETRRVSSAGGSLDRMSDDGKRTKEWSISWGTATLEYTSDQQFGGTMKDVRGTIYDKGIEASTFVAHEAVADKGTSKLKLLGGVKVKSIKYNGQLICGEIVYDGVTGVIEAKSGISADYKDYFMRGLEHVKVKADLTVIATPDMFEKSK